MSNIHLIGIGGAGLSAIAAVLLQQGYAVSGSDVQASPATERLAQLGATVFIGHRPENLPDRVDAVIISSAIPAGNPELRVAQQRGLRVVKRAEWLGQMMQGRVGIAIAGTHGKTTTTALTAFLLQQAGLDPTYMVGGFVPQLGGNAAAGLGQAFVIEADEYDYMFLGLRPQMAVVTMVEWDHPDIFPTPQAFEQAFVDFVQLVPPDGLVIGCGDEPKVRRVLAQAQARVITYGLQAGNDWQAVELQPNRQGGHDFKVKQRMLPEVDSKQPNSSFTPAPLVLPARASVRAGASVIQPSSFSLSLPGVHNVLNALAGLIVADQQGIPLDRAAEILSRFKGVGRRFELKGEVNGITVIDDYAHHPTEIRATLAAARSRFGDRPIWAVFQPHTFSRTVALLDDFAAAFDLADHVIIVDIFASREVDEGQIHSRELVQRMAHPDARYLGSLREAAAYLVEQLAPPAVLLTLGAGDGYQVGEWVLEKLNVDGNDLLV